MGRLFLAVGVVGLIATFVKSIAANEYYRKITVGFLIILIIGCVSS